MIYDLTGVSPARQFERREFGRITEAVRAGMEWIAEGWNQVRIGGEEGLAASEHQIRELHRLMTWVDEGVGPVPAI